MEYIENIQAHLRFSRAMSDACITYSILPTVLTVFAIAVAYRCSHYPLVLQVRQSTVATIGPPIYSGKRGPDGRYLVARQARQRIAEGSPKHR
jgi:hypothetical protein